MVNLQKVSESVMAILQRKPRFALPEQPISRISALDSTRYTSDMLENLRKIAAGQGQTVLAHLLELAQAEAKLIVREQTQGFQTGPQTQPTRLPG